MLLRFLKQYAAYIEGEVVDLDDPLAGQLVDHGVATPAEGHDVRHATRPADDVRTATVKNKKA